MTGPYSRVRAPEVLTPPWPAPSNVHACASTRRGGVSVGTWASLNLASHVADAPEAVAENRRRLCQHLGLPREPTWMTQVHGRDIVDVDDVSNSPSIGAPVGDIAIARHPGSICAILSADCLPVLLCEPHGEVVAAVHAGWRGLAAGVLQRCVAAMGTAPEQLLAWIGPGIGGSAYEVGEEVHEALIGPAGRHAATFRSSPCAGPRANQAPRWLADLPALARLQLVDIGVENIYGGEFCTASDAGRFFSYRRDGATGRTATLIWISSTDGR